MRTRATSGIKVMSALLTALPGKQDELRQTLRSLQGEIRQQAGCLDCAVAQDTEGESRFLIFTVWKDLAFLEAHLDSESFRILLGATSVLSAPVGFRFIATDAISTYQGAVGRSGHASPTSSRLLS